jgi:hypothetical protein
MEGCAVAFTRVEFDEQTPTSVESMSRLMGQVLDVCKAHGNNGEAASVVSQLAVQLLVEGELSDQDCLSRWQAVLACSNIANSAGLEEPSQADVAAASDDLARVVTTGHRGVMVSALITVLAASVANGRVGVSSQEIADKIWGVING